MADQDDLTLAQMLAGLQVGVIGNIKAQHMRDTVASLHARTVIGATDFAHQSGQIVSSIQEMTASSIGVGANQIRTEVAYGVPFIVPVTGEYDGVVVGLRPSSTPVAGTERFRALIYNGDGTDRNPSTLQKDLGILTFPVAPASTFVAAIIPVTAFTVPAGLNWLVGIVSTDLPSGVVIERPVELDARVPIGSKLNPSQQMTRNGRGVRGTGTTEVTSAPASFPTPIIYLGDENTENPFAFRLRKK